MRAPNMRRRALQVCLASVLAGACSADGGSGTRDQGPGRPTIPNAPSAGRGNGSSIPGGAGSRSVPPAQTAGTGAPTTVGDSCAAISQTADNRLQPADIIIAVDNSGSMDEEIVFVREQLNAFSQQIVDSGVDVRIILITAPVADAMPVVPPIIWDDDDDQDNGICIGAPLGSGTCPADSNPPRYMHIAREVKSHDALNLFISTFPQWKDQLRPNATKTFVVVTDDNAEDEPNDSAGAFTQNVAQLDPALFAKWSLSGIYCFSECPDAAEIGTVYADLVQQTGGVGGDLCLQDFAPVFDALAKQVIGASKLDCAWDIPAAPMDQMFHKDRVNVQFTASGATPQIVFHVDTPAACGAQGGWHYDDNANPTRLLVCPSTCDQLQAQESAQLDVLFGCETKDGPD